MAADVDVFLEELARAGLARAAIQVHEGADKGVEEVGRGGRVSNRGRKRRRERRGGGRDNSSISGIFKVLHRVVKPADLVQRVRERVGMRVSRFRVKRARIEGAGFIPADIVERN